MNEKGRTIGRMLEVSILVLVEIRNQMIYRSLISTKQFMFQSLFWWKSEIKFRRGPTGKTQMLSVSILVLVEIRNQMNEKGRTIGRMLEVSILVLVEIRNQITGFRESSNRL